MRGIALVLVPTELTLLACLLTGAPLPPDVLLGVEAVAVTMFVVEGAGLAVLYRRGGRAAVREVVPEPVRRIVGHELRVLGSLALWVARRRHGVRAGDLAFGHARDQAAMMYGIVFVSVVETVGLSVLLRNWPAVHAVVLVVDVYGVVLLLGMQAASVTRPHVLSADALRVRKGAHRDLWIPLDRIAAVSGERRFTHEAADGVLDLPVAAQTSLTLELTEPVTAVGLLGGKQQVTTVRLHADEPEKLRAALNQALRAKAGPEVEQAPELTRARTVPSPPLDQPA
ncbi:hypothetical protein GCM10010277_25410 [Streptomyces longisporoflavus]|uniref:hypothetical protein n=1 Tax=Streptomyces longisporoflavus TaxID=28044 RepID=UPI001990A5E4|nr:hypothetical protein [Streptomyces longisporoflavus]GGV38301.1 hypothetical protein GCM10010277_25410 [Streptomyces longisporoflavus]